MKIIPPHNVIDPGENIEAGRTDHFVVYYAIPLGATGVKLADDILKTCEADLGRLRGFFGDVDVGSFPFTVRLQPGNEGARHNGCSNKLLTCDAFNGDSGIVRACLAAEVSECLMAFQKKPID